MQLKQVRAHCADKDTFVLKDRSLKPYAQEGTTHMLKQAIVRCVPLHIIVLKALLQLSNVLQVNTVQVAKVNAVFVLKAINVP